METEAFFCKQAGDVLRYMCEVNNKPGPQLKNLKDEASMYYERAQRKAENFHNCNATKMSLGLNFAVFTAEIMQDQPKAVKMAEMTLNKAQATLNSCEEDEFVEASYIIEMIKENIAGWKGEDPSKIVHQQY